MGFDAPRDSGGAPPAVRGSIQRLGTADTKDVQQIAASQLELLTAYHQVALGQSNRSFFWALIGSGIGLLLFVVAVGVALLTGLSLASIVPLIAGAVVNVISGIVFVLYGKTSKQLSAFHGRLEVLQRYLLANSICESLSDAERDKARAALIDEISRSSAGRRATCNATCVEAGAASGKPRFVTRPVAALDTDQLYSQLEPWRTAQLPRGLHHDGVYVALSSAALGHDPAT